MKKKEWVPVGNSGYWRTTTGESHRHKLPFFCPHCKKPTGTIDDKYYEEYGFCYECFTMNVDERKVPTIDIDYYKKLKNGFNI